LSFSQVSAVGHDGSDGRTRQTEELASVDFAEPRHRTPRRGIAAKRLKKALLFIRNSPDGNVQATVRLRNPQDSENFGVLSKAAKRAQFSCNYFVPLF
jgi:hypothetical protein